MIFVKLKDGDRKEVPGNGLSGYDLLAILGRESTRDVVALKVGAASIHDLAEIIPMSSEVELVTVTDAEGVEILRHDAAHIMAQAVKRLYPAVQVTIGPTIEDGFYYDFYRSEPFSESDLEAIETEMRKIIKDNTRIVREVWNRADAKRYFASIGENYKLEIIDSIDTREELTVYHQGDFVDLCRGPHSPSVGMVKAFKLLRVSGAYWRGDSKNVMLQRIYGTAWPSKESLEHYLEMLEEAKKRDHRKLGKIMDLFHIQDEAIGAIFWHEKGWTIYRLLQDYIRKKLENNGYIEVRTPVIVDSTLWKKSGHWDKFRSNMFIINQDDNNVLAVKPMNCPCHVQLFNRVTRSYKELPIRIAEFGLCHRNESSGSLYGTLRVREFVQDDAHIFCAEWQLEDEVRSFCYLLKEVYSELGFDDIMVKFSDRPEIRAGSEEVWDRAEESLRSAIEKIGIQYSLNIGEGAFYGPKLEFILKDCLGRSWQCGTLQVDFILPERLDARYMGSDGKIYRPVMIHRAIIGTFERFIGIMLEHYKGSLPLWLAPLQVVVASITDAAEDYAISVHKLLKHCGIRSALDVRNEKISYKVREHSVSKVPLIFVVGAKEMASQQVAVRKFGEKEEKLMLLEDAINMIKREVEVLCQQ